MSWKGIFRKAGLSVKADGGLGVSVALSAAGGLPLVGTVFGNAFFVDYRNGSDSNNGRTRGKAFKTLSHAVACVTTNNNDVVFIDGDSTVVEAAMVTIDVNRTHFVGINGPAGHFGAGAQISCAVAAGATNIATVKNIGVRNTFSNIKFVNKNTVEQGIYAFVEGGEYTRFNNCEFAKETDLDETGAADLVCNGDSPMFYGCSFGSSSAAISGATIRANILMTAAIAGENKVTRDAWFENCILWRKSSNAANRFVYGANADDIESMCVFKECLFMNSKISAAVPAQNVAFGSSLTAGEVLLWNCASMNAGTTMSATTGVFVLGYTPDSTGAAAGIPIQAA